MSVRRRNIGNRLAHDLERERGSHQFTRGLLDASQEALRLALEERDAVRAQRDRLLELAAELALYFSGDVPKEISRESDLFLLLQEVAPQFIQPLPPAPAKPEDFLHAMLNMAGVTMEDVLNYAKGAVEASDVTEHQSDSTP